MEKTFDITVREDVSGLGLVKGFKVGAAACDIRNKDDFTRLDLALVVSETPADAAGVFTTNDVKASPVLLDMSRLEASPKMRAIVANSGNANACTGTRGDSDADKMCELAAAAVGARKEEVLVCSTGRIGEFMPMEKVAKGIEAAAASLSNSDENSIAASRAIMTSDTRPKTVLASVEFGGGKINVAGMAKGAGMIEPNMATMLAFIVSDAAVEQKLLKKLLKECADKTFNRMTVDGDMSTNDTVLCLCNGAGGVEVSESNPEALAAFKAALLEVSRALARKIVGDGEKITKVVEVKVKGARDSAQAEKICRAIGNSLLVKSSWFGEDPNWGRLTDAAGYARTGLEYYKIDLDYDGVAVLVKGQPVAENKPLWKKIVSQKTFTINMNLNLGDAEESILAADLTEGYVNFNKGE
ncbi:MAG TPA: bifunctional glutamate N-acetyltransferase/amino-acid acetyltransferase ArgJ [Candidatus Merdousia gallistercoris]|nr:bifunctional glutamate N-acetyltransferase/amino-acid acetyltransferase ArgJ [Candidatus Merdousia gallistercoris]